MTRTAPMVLDWILESNVDEVKRVQLMVDELHEALTFEHDAYANILVAISEAVNNAILHGNQRQAQKVVRLKAEMTEPKWLMVTVQDEGNGFDYAALPDPTQPGHLLKATGRGIFLMRHLADELRYEDKGRRVTMRFRFAR